MTWFQREIQLPSFSRGFHPITHIVLDAVPEIAQIHVGLFHVFIRHTSASLLINENADPDMGTDAGRGIDALAAEEFPYPPSAERKREGARHAQSGSIGFFAHRSDP